MDHVHFAMTLITMLEIVTPPKLALANPVESLAIHPIEPMSGQTGHRPCI
jgi:hypothetical protein